MSPRIDDQLIHRIIESNDLVDLISEYVTLKKTGSSFKGRCPFHSEKTPSFTVSREKQLYHCFGCGAGGNNVSFVMDLEKLNFLEAIEFLARRANIAIVYEDGINKNENFRIREKYYEINRLCANYFYRQLIGNSGAIKYLKQRKISTATIKEFGLGYAPDSWKDTLTFLNKQGIKNEDLLLIGIASKSNSNTIYDRFRDRIIFPIINVTGKIIGFGGRIFTSDSNGAKYLNSPETLLFHKSDELYNLNNAKKNIINNQLIIVEGYLDVISLYQNGVKNCVATLGTALTLNHAKLISRYVDEVVLCFDGDTAGQKAALKAVEILRSEPLNVKVLQLEKDDDPDTIINSKGKEVFSKKVSEAITSVEYVLGMIKKEHSLEQIDGKLKYVNQAVKELSKLKNPLNMDIYVKKLSEETGVQQNVLMREITKINRSANQGVNLKLESKENPYEDNNPKGFIHAQYDYLRLAIKSKDFFLKYPMKNTYFSTSFTRKIFNNLEEYYKKSNEIPLSVLVNNFEDKNEKKEFSKLLMDFDEVNIDEKECVETLLQFVNIKKINSINNEIKNVNDDENTKELIETLIELKKEY